MKAILIVDTETTGLDPDVDLVLEVGAVLWSVEHKTTMVAYSSLVKRITGNPAFAVNGIPEGALPLGAPFECALADVEELAARADAIVAHNAEFDRAFLPTLTAHMPWICTKSDVKWPRAEQGASLVATVLAHGLGVASAHRALTDCRLIVRLLERCHELGHDVNAMLERGLRPKARFVAQISYDDRENAKAAGFRWEKPHWVRTMAVEDAAALPFPVRVVA